MEAPSISIPVTTPNTPITLKVAIDGNNRKFKLPLRELNAEQFPDKIRSLLAVEDYQTLKLERFSDSTTSFVEIDPRVPQSYKQLYRAAKVKQKLRFRATVFQSPTAGTGTAAVPKYNMTSFHVGDEETPRVCHIEYSDRWANEEPIAEPSDLTIPKSNSLQDRLSSMSLTRAVKEAAHYHTSGSWQVFCNNCDKPMADAHYHCSICDKGDYDLCETCVNSGVSCSGEDHWLIKRYIKNGKVVTSTTERTVKKPIISNVSEKKSSDIPGAFLKSKPTVAELFKTDSLRTCNGCVRVLPINLFVTCQDCDDFDFCQKCHLQPQNGHHPGHTFKPAGDGSQISEDAKAMCEPGRNIKHAAFCDACDERIFGVRHKCLDCPDWDLCNNCFKDSATSHAHHRFVPIYEALGVPKANNSYHHGVYCDGPLCNEKPNQTYIQGVRYKCAICPDTDFCANCEAHPCNPHNTTHPLIKFKTVVKGVSITTVGEDAQGSALPAMGDRVESVSIATEFGAKQDAKETLPPYSVESESKSMTQEKPTAAKTQSKEVTKPVDPTATPSQDATFVRDVIRDGTVFLPDFKFQQVWTLRNMGTCAWPIGCRVRHIGGDNMMINVVRSRVASVAELAHARESGPTEEVIEPGREVDFPVWMRSPTKPGKYISYWRLQGPDGAPFGHKLWCDIEVKADVVPVVPCSAQTVPAPPAPPAMLPYLAGRGPSCHPASRSSDLNPYAPSFPPMSLPPVYGPATSAPVQPPQNPGVRPSRPSRHDNFSDLYNATIPNNGQTVQGFPTFPAFRPEQEASDPKPPQGALGDYQMQMMLLEAQNRRKLAAASPPGVAPPPVYGAVSAPAPAPATAPAPAPASAASAPAPVPGAARGPTRVVGLAEHRQSLYEANERYRQRLEHRQSLQQLSRNQLRDAAEYYRKKCEQSGRSINQVWLNHLQEMQRNARNGPLMNQAMRGILDSSAGRESHQDSNNNEQREMSKPSTMTPNDRKVAHAAAAAAVSSVKPKDVNMPSLQSLMQPENEQSNSKKVADIRDYFVDKKSTGDNIEESTDSLEVTHSAMVFPKIEKDGSPASSTHLGSEKVANEPHIPAQTSEQTAHSSQVDTTTESETATSVAAQEDDNEAFETLSTADVQFYSAGGEDSADDEEAEVLTDEEYDILDASDEEFIASHGKSGI